MRNPKGQPRMDNPETLATPDTQDTRRRHTQRKKNHTRHRKLQRLTTRTPPKIGGEPR